ncbi:MAG: hypothetical protein PHU85_04620 [Phycisphaerae bacterium]|nr:hypothetical protein [Phycisphaerae bacterium]
MAQKRKGIYCIEAEWSSQATDRTSVAPLLELLSQVCGIRSYHRDAVNADAAEVLLARWCQKKFRAYPILWLACHGKEGEILFQDGRATNGRMTIDQIEKVLQGKCRRTVIYFGSCSVLDLNGNRWQRFLRRTEALAVCGYCEDVDWVDSSAFELLLLTQLQENELTRAGAAAIRRKLLKRAGGMASDLGFKMCVRGAGKPGRPRRSG